MKKCPYCAEEIQVEAIKCKHCGEWLKGGSVPKGERKTEEPPARHQNIIAHSENIHIPTPQEEGIGRIGIDEDKVEKVVLENEKEKRIRKWGWGWIILICIYAQGSKKLFTTNYRYSIFLEISGIILILGFYFWLRNKFLKKEIFNGRLWLGSLLAGLISFFAVTIPIGFILGLLSR